MSEPRYPSRYGEKRMVTVAQYLAELMCERRAKQEKRNLPPQFWQNEIWKKIFLQQVVSANNLLKRLDPERTGVGAKALSAFLRSEQGKGIYSLSPAWILPLVEKMLPRVQIEPPTEPSCTAAFPAIPFDPRPPLVKTPSVLSRLEKLDRSVDPKNGQEENAGHR